MSSTHQLRPYQADIVERTDRAKGNVLIELPTGGGKSFIAKHIIRREVECGGVALIVAPKVTLLEQLAETFDELAPQIIHGAKRYDAAHNVFVSTLQTAHKRKLGFTPTLIVIDEVHFGFTGKMIRSLLESYRGKVVGLSATPYDKQGKPLEGFDTHLNSYDIGYMIERGYLVPLISYRPVKVDLSGVRVTAGDYNLNALDEKFNTMESVMQVVEATREKIMRRKRALVFCITIRHAEAMAKAYSAAGVPALAIHSQMSKEQQAEALVAFKSGRIKLLANADMLTTGFDHPPTDTIVLARATKSQNLYRQMVGRVLRLAPGKSDAVLLDCAGVIGDLGLPTAPIRPKPHRNATVSTAQRCGACNSSRLYRSVRDNAVYRVCAECGHREELQNKNGLECDGCGRVYGEDARLEAEDRKLFMLCGCGHRTLISESSGHDELRAVFDRHTIDILTRRVTAAYCSRLIAEHGADFIFADEVKRQVKAIGGFIRKYPETFNEVDMETVELEGWRLIPRKLEKQFLAEASKAERESDKGIEVLKSRFYAAKGFSNAVKALNALLKAQSKESLKDWVASKTMQQINDSPIKGIEAMTVKRLKNLHSNGKDCNSIDTFVPYIEKQRGYGGRA